MTTTEAIKQLQTEHDLIAGEYDLDGSQFAPALLEALAMAIEALKAQDMTLYMNLPEVSAEEAVEILKRNNRIELISSGKDTNVPSNDTISRKQAIDRLETIGYDFSDSGLSETELEEVCEAVGDVRQDMIRMIKRLPSAQPSRIEQALHGKTPEEQYKILYQLMFEYANTFNDARRAVIDWLGE